MKPIALALLFACSIAAAQNQGWVARYHERGVWSNLPGTSPDSMSQETSTALAIDDSGNVYVCGTSVFFAPPGESDGKFVTLKYDRDGRLCWSSFYLNPPRQTTSGPGVTAGPASIAVDGTHNVYVTGAATNSARTDMDMVTIKYDINGNQLWAATYDGPAHAADQGAKVVLDQSGNVYVAGPSLGSGTDFDFATIKYDANGNQLWVSRFDGAAHRDDKVIGLAVDASGNAYVAGKSFTQEWYLTYSMVKYDPDGHELWNTGYSGSAHGIDDPSSMAVDNAGNLYVTGSTQIMNGDTVTVIDSATGLPVVRVLPGPWENDMALLKYDPSGNLAWLRTFNSSGDPQHLGAGSLSLTLDASGRPIVLETDYGNRYAVLKYGSDGGLIDVIRPSDFDGTLYLAGADANGNVYVCGQGRSYVHGGTSSLQFATLMFDATGTQIWDARYDNPDVRDANGGIYDLEYPTAMVADHSGNVYVTGPSYVIQTGVNIATVKYSGALLSSRQVASASVSLKAISFVGDQTGWAIGARGTILKTTDGGSSWLPQTVPGGTKDLAAISMVDNNVGYVVGKKGTILKTVDGGSTWALQQNGSQNWSRKDLLRVLFTDASTGIATGKSGAILKTFNGGASWALTPPRGITSMNDIAFVDLLNGWAVGKRGAISRTSDGGSSWIPVKSNNKNVTTSPLSRVSFSDPFHGWAAGSNVVLSTSDGGSTWTSYSLPRKRTFSSLHAGGNGFGAGVATNGSVVFLQPGGIINMSVSTTAHPLNDMCFLNASNAFAAGADGSVLRMSAGNPALTLPIPDAQELIPASFALQQNYPNPFNPITSIEYTLPEPARVTIKIYNLLGQEVTTLVDDVVDAGENAAEWDAGGAASGVYFCRVTAAGLDHRGHTFSAVKKMVFMK